MLLLTNLQPTKKLYFRKSTFAQCLDNALYEEIMKYLTSRICRLRPAQIMGTPVARTRQLSPLTLEDITQRNRVALGARCVQVFV